MLKLKIYLSKKFKAFLCYFPSTLCKKTIRYNSQLFLKPLKDQAFSDQLFFRIKTKIFQIKVAWNQKRKFFFKFTGELKWIWIKCLVPNLIYWSVIKSWLIFTRWHYLQERETFNLFYFLKVRKFQKQNANRLYKKQYSNFEQF